MRRSRLFANHLLSVLVYFCVEKSKIATPIWCPWNYEVYLAFRLKKRKTEMKSKDRGKDRKRHPKSKVSWSIVLFFSHFLWMDFQGAQSFRENWRKSWYCPITRQLRTAQFVSIRKVSLISKAGTMHTYPSFFQRCLVKRELVTFDISNYIERFAGADLGVGCWGCARPPPPGGGGGFLGLGGGGAPPPPPLKWPAVFQYNWYSAKNIYMWFIGVEIEQETSAPPPKKNPGSAPGLGRFILRKEIKDV